VPSARLRYVPRGFRKRNKKTGWSVGRGPSWYWSWAVGRGPPIPPRPRRPKSLPTGSTDASWTLAPGSGLWLLAPGSLLLAITGSWELLARPWRVAPANPEPSRHRTQDKHQASKTQCHWPWPTALRIPDSRLGGSLSCNSSRLLQAAICHCALQRKMSLLQDGMPVEQVSVVPLGGGSELVVGAKCKVQMVLAPCHT
jgi:hypothetical protein